MQISKRELEKLDRIKRLNIINSITGIKPANLIGTKSDNGIENLAIFSSVVHLGSNPPLVGMVTRPLGEVPRHTYENIQSSGIYTINAVPAAKTEEAHYTSAKFENDESEFASCDFEPAYLEGFDAPFVAESPIRFGLRLVEEMPIAINGTVLLIGEIEYLFIQDELVSEEGYINLDNAAIAGISGLNSYYDLSLKASYPYARREEVPNF